MGVYDMVEMPDNNWAQVKLWNCEMTTYLVGDEVPDIGKYQYSVATREEPGWFVNVIDNKIVSITKEPEVDPILDKWGNEFSGENSWLFGDRYYYWKE